MCNSLRHSSSCPCGFGPKYGNNGSSSSKKAPMTANQYAASYLSDVPNLFEVKCDCCGQMVYFVRNSVNGGCFLADEIDPWVIHPCWLERNQKNLLRSVKRYFDKPDQISGHIYRILGGTKKFVSLECIHADGQKFYVRVSAGEWKKIKQVYGREYEFSGKVTKRGSTFKLKMENATIVF